jgi:hypothetical protein
MSSGNQWKHSGNESGSCNSNEEVQNISDPDLQPLLLGEKICLAAASIGTEV